MRTSDYDPGPEVRINARDPKLDLRPTPKSKNTRKWCRGKKGVTHQLVVKDSVTAKPSYYSTQFNPFGKILFCSACGKEFGEWHPRIHPSLWPDPPIPAWVTEGPQAYVVR